MARFTPYLRHRFVETCVTFWLLVRIMAPVAIVAEALKRAGTIELIAPAFGPLMNLFGLPQELGLAWVTGMLVSIWGALPLVFTLVPMEALTAADMTVFAALLLFAHGLPSEQMIIAAAGPRILVTTLLRIGGGMAYAYILHAIFEGTGSLTSTVEPVWIPLANESTWLQFITGLIEALAAMFVVLLALSLAMDLLKATGILGFIMKIFSPALYASGIRQEAGHLTAVGLFLGISYGAGMLIREARSGKIGQKQIFLSCAFMGFAHSVIEDSLLLMAMGADFYGVFAGRLVFAIAATGLLALALHRLPDAMFHRYLFKP